MVLVFNEGKANEVRVQNGDGSFVLAQAEVALRTGSDAQRLTAKLLDTAGDAWRRVPWGSRVKVILRGTPLKTTFTVGKARLAPLGGSAVMVTIEAFGRTQVLYTETATEAETYLGQTTSFIFKDLVDTYFAGILGTSTVNTAAGAVVDEFEVNPGDNLGDLIEQLTENDGFTFEVDEADEARYYAVSASSQATFREEDLVGDPEDREVEHGAVPVRNHVRIKGTTGYATKTRQETQDAWRDITTANIRVAQRFRAETDRLSGVELYLDRTVDPNLPASLLLEVQTDATLAVSDTFVATTGGAYNLDAATKRVTYALYAGGRTDQDMRLVTVSLLAAKTGNPGVVTAHVYQADANWKPTGASLASQVLVWNGAGRLEATFNFDFDAGQKHCLVLVPASADVANYYALSRVNPANPGANNSSTDSGASYAVESPGLGHVNSFETSKPSGIRVEWSNDISISAGDVPYPAEDPWNATRLYSKPKLALTVGARYWLIARDQSATGTKYWRQGYRGTGDGYGYGKSLDSTDGGTTWTNLGRDLAFRLFWTQDLVDVTRTNARAKLTAPITDATLTLPVDRVDDFAVFPTDVTIEGEDITVTGRIPTSGPGNLTASLRGANGTTAAAHASGKHVSAYSIRKHGVWQYQATDERVTSQEQARAVAGVILAKHAEPLARMTLPLDELRPDLTPRAVVTVERPALDVDTTYEVAEVQHTLAPGGVPRTALVLGVLEYDAARAIEELRKET